MPPPIRTVLVAGYGTMGQGVLKSFAAGGFECTLLSRRAAELAASGTLPPGVTAVAALPPTAPDMIVENLPEDMEIKLLFVSRVPGGSTHIHAR